MMGAKIGICVGMRRQKRRRIAGDTVSASRNIMDVIVAAIVAAVIVAAICNSCNICTYLHIFASS